MFSTMGGIFRFLSLLLFSVLLASCGGGDGGDDGFTGQAADEQAIPITFNGPTSGTVGVAYSASLVASGGASPYTFEITTGSLPDGVSLNAATGRLSGTPTRAGEFGFTAQVTDKNELTGTATFTITVSGVGALTITLDGPTSGAVGAAYNASLVASGTAPYTFAIIAGSLPTGVSLNVTTGALSGTPTTVGAFEFTVRATDSNNATGTASFTITVNEAVAIMLSPTTGMVGVDYNATLVASGGTGPYTFEMTGGNLPDGVTLYTGLQVLSGTPTKAGTFTFSLKAIDSNGATGTKTITITITAITIKLDPPTANVGNVNVAYSANLVPSGGTAPYTFAVTAGSLPDGVTLNTASGMLSGTPTTAGQFTFTAEATDNNGAKGAALVTITVMAAPPLTLTLSGPATGTVGTAYSANLVASGGTAPYTFEITTGDLPTGVVLNAATGRLSGTPTTAGVFGFTAKVTDSNEVTGTATFTITVSGALTMTLSGPTTGTVGTAYSASLVVNGGTAPYIFAVTAGSLPDGVALNAATGVLSGTPTTAGVFGFTARVTDNNGATATGTFTITVNSVVVTLTLSGPATGTVGTAYSANLVASGGTAPYTFEITTGDLPTGVVLNAATGRLSGTPTTAGVFGFTARVTDNNGATATGTFTITVNSVVVTLTLSGPTSGTVGTAYSANLVASGGTAPYTFEITTGDLPTGVVLNAATGRLSGTPTTAGEFGFTAQVTDSNEATGTATFTITISNPVGSVVLLASPPQLETSGQIPVNLTAVVRDTDNVLMEDIEVTFNADNNGTLQVTRAVTDAAGTATAILTSPGDKENRDITVTATASDQQDSVVVPVIGTTITSAGPSTAVIGNQVDITFTLKDSAGAGISGQTLTITSEPPGNTIDNPSPVTNTAGQAKVKVTANVTGNIVASALGATGSHALTVATDRFVFTVPNPNADPIDICLSATNCTGNSPPQTLTVRLTTQNPPVGVANKTVAFETTRGILSASSAVTNSNGYASVTIRSTNAGPAVITATTTDTTSQPIQAQVEINFVATTPTQMTLQANPGTVSVNVPPNTDQKSTITATVRDVAFNLVKGVTVTFVLTDVTGGSISPASAVTDQYGQASTVYTAGSTSSALNGVSVAAAVTGFPAVTKSVTLTVAQRSLFITLGTGNTIEEPDATTYEYPYSVLVTDTAGLPVQNASVTLNIVPVARSTKLKAYFKGYYALSEDATPPWIWTPTAVQDVKDGTYGCWNEDLNQNGILDLGEDYNNNGTLEPGNVVTVFPTSMRTDESGFAFFKVRYAQQYANWVRAELSARATVAGSEATEVARFILRIAASDISSPTVSPPGNPSPFGESDICTDDK